MAAVLKAPISFVRTLIKEIDEVPPEGSGVRFVIWLTAMYVGLKGFYSQTTSVATAPFLRDNLGLDSQIVSEISTFRKLPWSMKPGFALISDIQPIGGYKKRSYVFIYALLGTLSSILVVTLPDDTLAGWNGNVAGMCFFFSNLYVAGVDCLTQGRYTVLAKVVGASVVSYVIFCANGAQMIVLSCIGYINDTNPRIALGLALPFGLAMFFFASMNYMNDEQTTNSCKTDWSLIRKHSRTILLAVVQLVCTIGLMAMTLVPTYKETLGANFRFYYVIFFSIAIVSTAFWALPRIIAQCNAYMYLCKIMQLSAGSALTFFYTKPRRGQPCEGNPNFDYVTYQTYAGFIDKLVTLFGVYLFQTYIRKWNARPAFWITTFLTCLAAIFDIVIVERWNRDYLGISDRAAYLFGSSCIEGLMDTLDAMPATLLVSKLCPKDVETTVYAILIANQNLGGTVSSYIGVDAQRWLGVKYSQNQCLNPDHTFAGMTFTGLSWILIIGDIILPLLTIPLTFWLIPNVMLDSDFTELASPQSADAETGDLSASVRELNEIGGPDPEKERTLTLQRNLTNQSLVAEQGTAEIALLTASYLRANTKQLDSEML